MDLVSVATGLQRQMYETHELPQSQVNIALKAVIEECAHGIRATYPEIAQNRNILATQTIKEVSGADRALLRSSIPLLVALTEGQSSEDFAQDIPALVGDAAGPFGNHIPPLPGVTRTFGRVGKIQKQLQIKGVVDTIVDSTWFRSMGILITSHDFVTIILSLTQLGLKLFGQM